jgi:hypothetical protein
MWDSRGLDPVPFSFALNELNIEPPGDVAPERDAWPARTVFENSAMIPAAPLICALTTAPMHLLAFEADTFSVVFDDTAKIKPGTTWLAIWLSTDTKAEKNATRLSSAEPETSGEAESVYIVESTVDSTRGKVTVGDS